MKEVKTPQGTIVIMLIYLVIILALWGSAYFTVVMRGATQ